MSLTAYLKEYTYKTVYTYTGETQQRSREFKDGALIIEEAPSVKEIVWSGNKRSTKYRVKFQLQMPYTYYCFYASHVFVEGGDKTRYYGMTPYIYWGSKPLNLSTIDEMHTAPLPNVYDTGETCLEDPDRGANTVIENINTFWGKSFNRDLRPWYMPLWESMQRDGKISKRTNVLQIFKHWQNNLNTEEKILDLVERQHYTRSEHSNLHGILGHSLLRDDNMYIKMRAAGAVEGSTEIKDFELTDYRVFDPVKRLDWSQELNII